MTRSFVSIVVGCVLLAPGVAHAILLGQVDDFQNPGDGTMGWIHGISHSAEPDRIATGGPAGANDAFLRNRSLGGFGIGSRHAVINEAQWSGDYVSAGVTEITAWMANFGDAPLNMRIGVARDFFGERYVSADPVVVPADGQWYPVTFGLTAADLVATAGTTPLDDVLSDVSQLRFMSAVAATFEGDAFAGEVGIDNITALPEPSALSLLALGVALSMGSRRRR